MNKIKEDGIRKELYKNEVRAQEAWEEKWGFLKNPRKHWEEETVKRDLPADIFKKDPPKKAQIWERPKNFEFELIPCEKVPQISSAFVGWRLHSDKNNLDRLTGPLYISRKHTMDPPLQSDEPDLKQQKFIFLG